MKQVVSRPEQRVVSVSTVMEDLMKKDISKEVMVIALRETDTGKGYFFHRDPRDQLLTGHPIDSSTNFKPKYELLSVLNTLSLCDDRNTEVYILESGEDLVTFIGMCTI